MMNLFYKCTSSLLFFLTAGLILTYGLHAQNIVTNGSFENTPPGVYDTTGVDGWVIQIGSVSIPPEISIVDDTVQQGSHSMRIIVNAAGTNPWDIQVVADSLPVQRGETYSYSIWAKSSGTSQVTFTVGAYVTFSEYAAIRPASPNVNKNWQKYTTQFTVNDAQTFVRGPIHFSVAANVGDTIWIDNLKINNVKDPLKPIVVEAESGTLGDSLTVLQNGDTSYVTALRNYTGFNPGNSHHVGTYQITFPDSGTFNFYVRVRTNTGGFNDDSFFFGNGFGTKDTLSDEQWIFVNQLAAAGFADSADIVYDPGGLGNGIWKWVNLTRNHYTGDSSGAFIVKPDSLTRIFQIATREDGLDIDKFAFGRAGLYYTVWDLDNAAPGSTQLPSQVWNGPPLASGQPKWVGSAYSPNQAPKFEDYWNQVTPENDGKWGTVEGTKDVMNWSGLDAAYNFAKDNGFPFHFHVLVWGQQQPSWISSLPQDEQLQQITEWFQAVADRYPDIDYLEVVNEALPSHNPPDGQNGRANYKAALGGDGTTGWDWVLNAFRLARQIFPRTTKLMLNDYSIISSSSSTVQYLNLIRLLQADTLVDIICEQGHTFTVSAASVTMKKNLDSLASTGLPIQITEFDINNSNDASQLSEYKRVFPLLYQHPGVMGITLWGWRVGLWQPNAYLFTNSNTERPALAWLRDYLDTVNIVVSVDAAEGTPRTFQLFNNYPNPFNPSTKIKYNIAAASNVSLKIYDILGREVETLVDQMQSPGQYTVTFNAQNLSSGIYLYRIEAGNFIAVKKLILMK
ncbi:MAG TPA: endo-1,4-beta-xylanase [Ignavibacteriaceae bacterium]|nr:endo-1,4-beta-xylanase [Ignavibacteriaceae bacterium]